MKRTKTIAVILLTTVFAIGPVYAADLSAAIRECTGTVEVKFPGGEWIPAQAGMVLDSQTMISTGFKSNAVLTLSQSTLMVRPLTRLSLEELTSLAENEQVGLNLRAGRVRVDVVPPRDGTIDFKIISPMATASVRGTQFEFDAVNLTVLNGSVAYTGRDNATILAPAGRIATVNRQGRSTPPTSREEQQMAQGGAGAGVEEAAVPPVRPVSPVVASPGGILTVPGIIGAPGGGVSSTAIGSAEIDANWR
jgi:hypothetical protein